MNIMLMQSTALHKLSKLPVTIGHESSLWGKKPWKSGKKMPWEIKLFFVCIFRTTWDYLNGDKTCLLQTTSLTHSLIPKNVTCSSGKTSKHPCTLFQRGNITTVSKLLIAFQQQGQHSWSVSFPSNTTDFGDKWTMMVRHIIIS